MGYNKSDVSSAAGVHSFVAGNAITAGDFISLANNGEAYAVEDADVFDSPSVTLPVDLGDINDSTGLSHPNGSAAGQTGAIANDGTIANVLYNAGTPPHKFYVQMFNTTTKTMSAAIDTGSEVGTTSCYGKITAFGNNFVYANVTSSGGRFEMGVYNSAGEVITANVDKRTELSMATTSTNDHRWNIVKVSDTLFAVVYSCTNTGDTRLAVYDENLVLQNVPANAVMSASLSTLLTAKTMPNGNLVVLAFFSNVYHYYQFDHTDYETILYSTTNVGSSIETYSYGNWNEALQIFANNNIAIIFKDNGLYNLSVYDAVGVEVNTEVALGSVGSSFADRGPICALYDSGTKLFVCDYNNNSRNITVSDEGILLRATISGALLIGKNPDSSNDSIGVVRVLGANSLVFMKSTKSVSSDISAAVGTPETGFTAVTELYDSTAVETPNCFITDTGVAFATGSKSGVELVNIAQLLKFAAFGAALDTASVGGTLRVATVGTYPINQTALGAGSFDNTAATPPGSKGVLAGSTVTLFGLEA